MDENDVFHMNMQRFDMDGHPLQPAEVGALEQALDTNIMEWGFFHLARGPSKAGVESVLQLRRYVRLIQLRARGERSPWPSSESKKKGR